MRNTILLDNISADAQQVSGGVNFDKRVEWKLNIVSSGLDGTPKIFIEESYTGSKCTPPTTWTVYKAACSTDGSFDVDDNSISIEKNDFKLNWFRIRFEPNGNTTGNITATLHYKTFP